MPKALYGITDKITMSELNGGFDLISQMVNETFIGMEEDYESESNKSNNIQIEIEKEPLQLEFYYDFYLGAFDEERKCFVFQIEQEVIEFPENWGPFKLNTYSEKKLEDLFNLQKSEDLDLIFEIIEDLSSKPLKSLKCVNCGTHLKLVYEVLEVEKLANVIPFRITNYSKAA